ncbi:MAG: S1 family peptidase [Nannocystaceae bacterium]|nr:S1 family peptidase [bacterium]
MLLAALLTASGLSAPPDPAQVIGGDPAPAGQYDAVVRVDRVHVGNHCSGTLVRPDLVLTAAHCVDDIADTTGLRIWFTSGISAEVADFGFHPDYCESCDTNRFDYAYVRLSDPVDAPAAVTVVTDQEVWDSTMQTSDVLTVVGFGDVPDRPVAAEPRWLVEVPIRRFTGGGIEVVAGGDGRDSCEGDSGGAAFVTAPDGTLQLVAITSRGSDPCGAGGYYGVAYHTMGWLSEVLDDATLCGESCSTCDCLDTRPLPEDGCCSTDRPQDAPWLLLVLVPLARRRR